MTDFAWRLRGRAALIHLIGSALVAALAAALVFLIWYPWPFTALAGGIGLFVLITTVDIVMGPVITFAIFDRNKKSWPELRRDLAIVVLLQLAALGYGVHTMFVARPVALALETDRFRVATANGIVEEELADAPAELRRLPRSGVMFVRTVPPTEAGEIFESIERAFAGADLGMRPKYWRAWDAVARQEAKEAGKPLSVLRDRYPTRAGELYAAISDSGRREADLRFIPIISRFADWVALVDANTGDIVGFAPFNAY